MGTLSERAAALHRRASTTGAALPGYTKMMPGVADLIETATEAAALLLEVSKRVEALGEKICRESLT